MSRADFPNGTGSSLVPDYEWRYEYYDEEEPVSFEGLRAHRYSIVIVFWVGLAVFVIFMFFLLTLLTKTGAPQTDSSVQTCEKQPHLIGYMDTNLNNVTLHSHPGGLNSPCSLLHCYVSKDVQVGSGAQWTTAGGGVDGDGASGGDDRRRSCSVEEVGGALLLQELAVTANRTDIDTVLLSHFNIPNTVNSDAVGELLLLGAPELPIILEGRDQG
uniref:melanocortin-2 receptor accessory protein 2A-like n=1 Tax=Semicossyphus pulcher TaxID=241346 RepID=UPI0037E84F7F